MEYEYLTDNTQLKIFDDAIIYCRDEYQGRLTDIENTEENTKVWNQIDALDYTGITLSNWAIGLEYITDNSEWRWVSLDTKEIPSYTNWGSDSSGTKAAFDTT